MSLQGDFRFTTLSLNGFPITSNNETLFILLSEKNSQYYALLSQLQNYVSCDAFIVIGQNYVRCDALLWNIGQTIYENGRKL